MGFFDDFFDNLGDLLDIGRDIVMLPAEIVKDAIECATDINEAVVQDVQHKLSGEPDKPIETSYDIRDKADKIISSANRKFYDEKENLSSVWQDVSREAEQVADKRGEVYRMLGQAMSKSLARLPNQPSELVYPSNAPYVSASFDVGTSLGIFGIGTRMEAAEEYLQKADEYRVEVDGLICKIKSLERTVRKVSDAQKEEMAILDTIQSAYQTRSRDVLTQSADLLHEIAVLCVQEMSANTQSKYNELLHHLRSLWY